MSEAARVLALLGIVGTLLSARADSLTAVVAVAAGPNQSIALRPDGTVVAWGLNSGTTLPNGEVDSRNYVPTTVPGLEGVARISSYAGGNVALKGDGTVWFWRYTVSAPQQVPGLIGIVAVAASVGGGLAVKGDGTVWAWGGNSSGQLGNGTTTDSAAPVQVIGLSGVIAVAAGSEHGVALKGDGTVWAWGDNLYGELGNGTNARSLQPVQVSGLNGIDAIAAGDGCTLALKSDGTVWIWGQVIYATSSVPTPVPGLSGIVAIALGRTPNAALKDDGTVWMWNNSAPFAPPVPAAGLTGVTAIAAGDAHLLAVRSDGTVWGWGSNVQGQLANKPYPESHLPVQVSGLAGIAKVATGYERSLVLRDDGTVWALGIPPGADVIGRDPVPCPIDGLTGVRDIAAGIFNIAAKDDGTVWTWDSDPAYGNTYGQLGSSTHLPTPGQMPGLAGIVAVGAGYYHGLALGADGTVQAWGDNLDGELGNGQTTTAKHPVGALTAVPGLSGVIAVAPGMSTSAALRNDGTVWTWGFGGNGQLGNLSTPGIIPAPATGLTGVIQLADGGDHLLALRGDGAVWGWGDNSVGQLGLGTFAAAPLPVPIPGLGDVTALAAASGHSVALKSDGTAWAWGTNLNGQLGLGTADGEHPPLGTPPGQNTPLQVPGIEGAVALSTGGRDNSASAREGTLILKADGTVAGWDIQSELGNQAPFAIPTQIDGLNLTAPGIPVVALGSPADGAVLPLGQTATLQVAATDGGGTVAKVEYYNERIKIGQSTAAPFTLPWQPPTWGDFHLTAVATDDHGTVSFRSAPVAIHVPYDSDGNGLPDWWEVRYLGHLGNDPGSSPDGNGLTLAQDYAQGNDPADYYSQGGQIITPTLTIISGNNQESDPAAFTPQSLVVQVTNNGMPMANAPISLMVTQGGGGIAATNSNPAFSTPGLQLRTDGSGNAAVYYLQPNQGGILSHITVAVVGSEGMGFFVENSSRTSTVATTPTNFVATAASSTTVDLTWTNNSATGTLIEESLDGGATWQAVASVGAGVSNYTVTGISPGSGVSFRASATVPPGSSSSAPPTVTTPMLMAPTISASGSGTNVILSWGQLDAGVTVALKRKIDSGGWETLATVTDPSYTDTVGIGADYHYRITTIKNTQGSGESNEVAYQAPVAITSNSSTSTAAGAKQGTGEFANASTPSKYYLTEATTGSWTSLQWFISLPGPNGQTTSITASYNETVTHVPTPNPTRGGIDWTTNASGTASYHENNGSQTYYLDGPVSEDNTGWHGTATSSLPSNSGPAYAPYWVPYFGPSGYFGETWTVDQTTAHYTWVRNTPHTEYNGDDENENDSWSLSSEYTTAQLESDVVASYPAFAPDGIVASRYLSSDETTYSLRRCQYTWTSNATVGNPTLNWYVLFYPDDYSIAPSVIEADSWKALGTSGTYSITPSPTGMNGTYGIVMAAHLNANVVTADGGGYSLDQQEMQSGAVIKPGDKATFGVVEAAAPGVVMTYNVTWSGASFQVTDGFGNPLTSGSATAGIITPLSTARDGDSITVTMKATGSTGDDFGDDSFTIVYQSQPIQVRVATRDDPTKNWSSNVQQTGLTPVYAGLTCGDMVSWKVDGDPGSTFTWKVTDASGNPATDTNGSVISGPSGVGMSEWRIADQGGNDPQSQWLTWKPGTYTITCTVNSSVASPIPITFKQEVGFRDPNVAVVAWIDPTKVPLDPTGVDSDVVAVLPTTRLTRDGDIQLAKIYMGASILTGLLKTPTGMALFPVSGALTGYDLTPTDKAYILDWMFKFSANYEAPPSSFDSQDDLAAFEDNQGADFKCVNNFQIKYRIANAKFASKPTPIHNMAVVGISSDPFGGEDVGQKLTPPNGFDGQIITNPDNTVVYQINEVDPAALAVRCFNKLGAPRQWNPIGSQIAEGIGEPDGFSWKCQVYPTYNSYVQDFTGKFNAGSQVVQTPDPSGNVTNGPSVPFLTYP